MAGEPNTSRLLNTELFARRQQLFNLSQEPFLPIARARQSNYRSAQLPQVGRHEKSHSWKFRAQFIFFG